MRIRAALLALTATVVAGSAIAATPAAAQDFYRPGFERPIFERGFVPVYGYRYERPRFEHRWGYPAPFYGYGYGYGYHPYHAYRPYWR